MDKSLGRLLAELLLRTSVRACPRACACAYGLLCVCALVCEGVTILEVLVLDESWSVLGERCHMFCFDHSET